MEKLVTNEVRLSYPYLFTPILNKQSAELEYRTDLLIPKSDVAFVAAFNAAIDKVIAADPELQKTAQRNRAKLKLPQLKDGDLKEDKDGNPVPEYAGNWHITVKTDKVDNKSASKATKPEDLVKPVLYCERLEKGKKVPGDLTNPTEIYGGVYARALVKFFKFDNSYGQGVSIRLIAVVKTRDGESFGKAPEEFNIASAFGLHPAEELTSELFDL